MILEKCLYAVDFNRMDLIFCVFFFLFRMGEENNFLWFTDSFLFYGEFLIFVKFIFELFEWLVLNFLIGWVAFEK